MSNVVEGFGTGLVVIGLIMVRPENVAIGLLCLILGTLWDISDRIGGGK